jgi:hypothetical protein
MSYIRDDAVENDWFKSGMIEDCLIDGCYTFYSSRNKAKWSVPEGRIFTVKNCLIRMQNLPVPGYAKSGRGWGNVFKDGNPRNPGVVLEDNIFLLEKPHPDLIEKRQSVIPSHLKASRNNIVIWLGDGSYTAVPDGFKVLYGDKGKAIWNKAKAEWIKNHPQVPRLPSDP